MKKIIAFILAALSAVMLTSCGNSPDKSDRPSVSIMIKVPTLTMECTSNQEIDDAEKFMRLAAEKFKAAYDKADVTIQVEAFDYVDEGQSIVGCYGTTEAVDVLYEGYFNMAAYVSDGYVVPLDDIISDELRADISTATWEQSMKNGKTYMMPFLSMQNVLIYNRQLFEECGLEQFISGENVIQNWTIEEWELILDTLAEKLPKGSYPMMMYGANNQGDTHIMCLLRSFGGEVFDAAGNFDFENEKVLQAMEWLQNGVERGWYAPHAENIELADNYQLFVDGKLGIYLFNNANFALYHFAANSYGYVNFPGNLATSFVTGFEVFDNGDPAKVQVAKDFIKFIYEDEELLDLSAGNIPESKKTAAKYAASIEMLEAFSNNMVNVVDFMNGSPNWQGKDDSVRSVFWPHIHDLLAGKVTPEQCAKDLNRDCNAAIQVDTKLHE